MPYRSMSPRNRFTYSEKRIQKLTINPPVHEMKSLSLNFSSLLITSISHLILPGTVYPIVFDIDIRFPVRTFLNISAFDSTSPA